jgi:hypothetical protein
LAQSDPIKRRALYKERKKERKKERNKERKKERKKERNDNNNGNVFVDSHCNAGSTHDRKPWQCPWNTNPSSSGLFFSCCF